MRPPTRVLVCDDSKTFAAALVRTLEHDGEIEVVGVATNAEAAIADLARLEPDLVTMDIELPGMSGLEAVEQIMSARPTPILILSSHVGTTSNVAAAALAAGALEAIGKEGISLLRPGRRSRVRLSAPREAARRRARDPPSPRAPERRREHSRARPPRAAR